eukprot:scaffold4655_cov63-Skeletonema_marinoi.AAC.1
MSPRVPSTAALLPHRSKKAKHPIAIIKLTNRPISIDMSPRVPSSAALLPHRSKKAKHPIAANEK